jgi:hypothetical protein
LPRSSSSIRASTILADGFRPYTAGSPAKRSDRQIGYLAAIPSSRVVASGHTPRSFGDNAGSLSLPVPKWNRLILCGQARVETSPKHPLGVVYCFCGLTEPELRLSSR